MECSVLDSGLNHIEKLWHDIDIGPIELLLYIEQHTMNNLL